MQFLKHFTTSFIFFVILLLSSLVSLISPSFVFAQGICLPEQEGQCIGNSICLNGVLAPNQTCTNQNNPPPAQPSLITPREAIGEIGEPPGTEAYNRQVQGEIAIFYFISNMIRVGTIVAGIWVIFNVMYAGFIYITSSGDASAHGKISQLLFQSVLGLLLIITSYTIAALVGLIVFGDAGFIINPTF